MFIAINNNKTDYEVKKIDPCQFKIPQPSEEEENLVGSYSADL